MITSLNIVRFFNCWFTELDEEEKEAQDEYAANF
jgi:hypothetical protein